MKRLRNVGIYYLIVGLLMAASFVFFQFWRIAIVGAVLLAIYAVLKLFLKKKNIPLRLSTNQLRFWDALLILAPIIFVSFTLWYVWRPYNQTVVVPTDYEGVVVLQYDDPAGQPKKWIGGFLGFGASRLINVDSTGVAATQFGFISNSIPLLGMKQLNQNSGGLKIYYANDLKSEIVPGADGSGYSTFMHKTPGLPNIYFTEYSEYPLIIFVISRSENYNKYFMTDVEKDAWVEQQKAQNPGEYIERYENMLRKKENKISITDTTN